MYPPPITNKRSGIVSKSSAVVEVSAWLSISENKGGQNGWEPVAIIQWSKINFSLLILRLFASRKRALPLTNSTPRCLQSKISPLAILPITFLFHSRIRFISISGG